MEFGPFGFSPEQIQEFRTLMANQQTQSGPRVRFAEGDNSGNSNAGEQQQNSTRQPSEGNGNNPGESQRQQGQDEPVLMHNAQHVGVVCDVCNTEIRGFRYKCMQCADFDLCSKCEHKGHHAGHIMMRISFPEQARDAIRRYLSNGSCPPSPPTPPRHHWRGPHHGQGPFAFGFGGPSGQEEGPFGRRSCHRRGRGHHGHGAQPGQGQEGDSDGPTSASGKRYGLRRGGRIVKRCPYDMGKKEFKKWAKWMKKAAAHQHRSAEAYARAASASGSAAAGASSASPGTEAAPEFPLDFAAVASQIQEFLNYWGVPVDVVELYDQFGNRGQPNAAGNEQSTTQPPPEQTSASASQEGDANNTTSAAEEGAATTETQDQSPASPAAATLSENMQQMQLNETQNTTAITPRDVSLLMDLEVDDSSGWTIVDNSREQSPGNSVAAPDAQQTPSIPTAPQGSQDAPTTPVAPASGTGSINSNNGNGNSSSPFVSMGSTASSGQSTAAPSAPAFPNGVPLYPVLNTPQLQQILQGVSSAVSSVVRSIPIVTDPRGPVGTNVTNASSGQLPSTGPESADGNVELDGRCMKTLNQLLAMGFSNEGGYLTRLVIAKNGDLEAVLSSLFPN